MQVLDIMPDSADKVSQPDLDLPEVDDQLGALQAEDLQVETSTENLKWMDWWKTIKSIQQWNHMKVCPNCSHQHK